MNLQTLTQKDVLTTAVFTYSLTSSPDPELFTSPNNVR